MLSLNDWITSSNKYPDRAKSSELTDDVKKNAQKLIDAVNGLLTELNFSAPKVSSGFRPSSVNAGVGGAKKSYHMTGLAVDIVDQDGKLDEAISSETGQLLLEKYGLWQEHPSKTKSWEHIDIAPRAIHPRPGCSIRQFWP